MRLYFNQYEVNNWLAQQSDKSFCSVISTPAYHLGSYCCCSSPSPNYMLPKSSTDIEKSQIIRRLQRDKQQSDRWILQQTYGKKDRKLFLPCSSFTVQPPPPLSMMHTGDAPMIIVLYRFLTLASSSSSIWVLWQPKNKTWSDNFYS